MAKYNLLNKINSSKDVKKLSLQQQEILCWEIRQKLIHTVSKNGGHLASNLGVVELTVALHTVFDLPKDQIVWDVGHQCYTHKLLTARREQFSTLRQENGISGYPRQQESPCDSFIAGHASTSVSAAYGLAKAKSLTGDEHHVIAVVGDGACTGGMIYEAFNNAGRSDENLIVIINDNDMSISKSVGSLARYLAKKRASTGYIHLKDKVEETVKKVPVVGGSLRNIISDSKAMFRQAIYHSNFFEDFGFDYLGPVDGHNLKDLIPVLHRAKELKKPVVVHVYTVKGKGYIYAEQNPSKYHGIGAFDKKTGECLPSQDSFSSVFGETLTKLARKDKKICAITAAMQQGTGLVPFVKEFSGKGRFFDVGIAEEHAVTFASGLAANGILPVFAVYSTFLQRGYDQLIHDASIERQHIVLAVDRAGIVGDDGETHQGMFDAAFLSSIPNTTVYSPSNYGELGSCLSRAIYEDQGVCAVRYPRGSQGEAGDPAEFDLDYIHRKDGGQTLLITYGREYDQAVQAQWILQQQGKKVDILKLIKISPLPAECIALAKKYRNIFFLEEGVKRGGIGEYFLSGLAQLRYRGNFEICGIEQPFIPPMTITAALKRCGLDAQSIADRILEL